MDPFPDWTSSVRTAVRYRKWSLSGLLDIKHGGQVWNGTKGALYNFGTHLDTDIRGKTRTFGKDFMPGPVGGPGADTPVVIDQAWFTGLGSGFGPVASQFIEDGGFTKLRELSVGYIFDGAWVDRLFSLGSIEVQVAGRNLKTWTNYTGVDPELNSSAQAQFSTSDFLTLPQVRYFTARLALSF